MVGGAESRPCTLSSPSVAIEIDTSCTVHLMPVHTFSSSRNFFLPRRQPSIPPGRGSGSSRGSSSGSEISSVTRPTSTRSGTVLSDWKLARTVTVSMYPLEITRGQPGMCLRSQAGSISRSRRMSLLPDHEKRRNFEWCFGLKSSTKSERNSCSMPPRIFSILPAPSGLAQGLAPAAAQSSRSQPNLTGWVAVRVTLSRHHNHPRQSFRVASLFQIHY
jgi:hypothetical protein